MAKEALIQKHKRLAEDWQEIRAAYARIAEMPKSERAAALEALETKRLKKRYYKTRQYNRCALTGRARGYIRYFGVCRQVFREKAHRGELPGVRKASW